MRSRSTPRGSRIMKRPNSRLANPALNLSESARHAPALRFAAAASLRCGDEPARGGARAGQAGGTRPCEGNAPRQTGNATDSGDWEESARRLDLTGRVKFRSENLVVATVSEQGMIVPVADGKTAIVVEQAGQSLRCEVEITAAAQDCR